MADLIGNTAVHDDLEASENEEEQDNKLPQDEPEASEGSGSDEDDSDDEEVSNFKSKYNREYSITSYISACTPLH
jgi:hypothetical protein